MKAEFECMEAYLKELDALKNYDEVKKLSEEIPNLKAKLSEVEAERDRLKEELTKKQQIEDKAIRLEETLKQTQKELATLKEVKIAFQGGHVSLKDAEQRFLKSKDDEINARTERKFKALKMDLDRQMPALIYNRLVDILKGSEWPADIAGLINKEGKQIAEKMVGEEFKKRVNVAASEKIKELKRTEWPVFLQNNVSPIASSLKTLVNVLQKAYCLRCDKCEKEITVNLGPREIAILLAGGYVECPYCKDFQLPPAPPFTAHKIAGANLEGFIRIYLAEGTFSQ